MTVAINSDLSMDAAPSASAGGSGSAGTSSSSAALFSNRPAGMVLGSQTGLNSAASGNGSLSAESFRAQWQSELAAMNDASQGEDEGEATTAESDAADRARAGANGALSASSTASSTASSIASSIASANVLAARNSAAGGLGGAQFETGPAESAESQGTESRSAASKDTQDGREARNKDNAQGQAKHDSPWDSASALTSMEMMPGVLAAMQQQLQVTVPANGAAAGVFGGALGKSSAGNTDRKSGVESGTGSGSATGAVHPARGLAPRATAAGVTGVSQAAGGSEGLTEAGAHGSAADGAEQGSGLGSSNAAGGQESALPAVAQGIHAADANTAANTAENTQQADASGAAGAQGDTGQSTTATASGVAASHEAASASRLARNQSVGQSGSQSIGEGSAVQGHENGGMAITPALGVAGATHGMPSQPGGTGGTAQGSSSGSASGPLSAHGAGETFAAMDAQGNGSGLTWVHAGPQQAEAGFQDPTLGWVAVRAGMGSGGVHAAIVPGTAEAAQTLDGHMAGLSAHLAEQRVGVSSVSMNNPGNSLGNGPGAGPDLAGGNGGHSGAGQGQQQSADTGGSYAVPGIASTTSSASTNASMARGTAQLDGGMQQPVAAGGMTGRHISVVA